MEPMAENGRRICHLRDRAANLKSFATCVTLVWWLVRWIGLAKTAMGMDS